MSDAQIESGGGPPRLDESTILQEQIKKLQILDLTDEVLKKILSSPQTKVDFIRDIDAVSSQIPPNPSEISRMELLYIKGYGQEAILKDGSKMSFAEIARLPSDKKDDVLDNLTKIETKSYQEWRKGMKEVANQTEKNIDKGTQAAIEEGKNTDKGTQAAIEGNKEVIKKEEELKSQIDALQKINGVPKPDIRELQKTAQNISELQGVSVDDIKSGKYNNILLADYYVTHAKDISGKLSADDVRIFQNSINNLSDTLIRPRITDFEKLTSSLALGSARDTINTRGASLINEGYSKSVIWDPRERTISFQNDRGEVKILETTTMPPRERVQSRTLSISREITPTVIDLARERNDTKRNTVAQIVPAISRDTKELLSGKMGDGSDITSPGVGGMLDNTLSHISLRSPDSARLSRTMVETASGVLRMEQARLEKVIQDKTMSNPLDPDIGGIRGALTRMTTIIESLQKIQEKATLEEENPQNNTLLWDKNVRDNLDWLTDSYFDRMGSNSQQVLDRIISLVNKDRTPSNQIQLGEALSPMSKNILERSLIKLGGTPDVLTNGERLPGFQNRIKEALRHPAENEQSIEGILRKT